MALFFKQSYKESFQSFSHRQEEEGEEEVKREGEVAGCKKEKGDCVYVTHCHLMLKCDLSCDTFSKSDLDCFLCS